MNPLPFSAQSKTLKVSVTTSASTSGALPGVAGNSLRVVNEGPNTAFISIGTTSQTATVPATSSPVATCTPVLPGSDVVFTVPADAVQNISAITATGTATLYVSVGEGI